MIIPELAFESEWILKTITNEIRRKILYLIEDYTFLTYSDLLRDLKLSTGKLNFHLRQLTGLIEKKDEKTYRLTSIGKKSIDLLKQIQSLKDDKHEVMELKSLFENLSIKKIRPAEETKKKWFISITGYFVIIMILWSLLFSLSNTLNSFLFHQLRAVNRILIFIGLGLAIFGTIAILLIILVNYYIKKLEYEILDTEIVIRRGVITRTKTVIPFRTITNLLIKRGPLDRLFGISTILIQTAGESKSNNPEGRIVGIYYPHKLLEEILNLVRLLDPPRYLKEHTLISYSPLPIRTLYSEILDELNIIKDRVSDNEEGIQKILKRE